MAVAAVLTLGVAGVMIARSVRLELRDRSARRVEESLEPVAKEPALLIPNGAIGTADDPGAARSRLALVRVGEGANARTVVTLARPVCSDDFEGAVKGTLSGLLAQELFRQAVLLAARDELGLATRDEVLGEATADTPTLGEAEVVSIFRDGGKTRAVIRRVAGKVKKGDLLYDQPVPGLALPDLVERTETLSRTDFPRVLSSLDREKKGTPNPRKDEAPLPEGVDEKLAHLGMSDQFEAIRTLHAAIRADGESPARLAALARSYALLGVLTEFLWHPAHKVYKARALLYSQRLVARDLDAPMGHWNRAFVRALVGMHFGARGDLTRAAKLVKAQGAKAPEPPAWVPLIDAYLRYDTRNLRTEEAPLESLAALLRMMAWEFPRSKTQALPAATALLGREPDCFRATDLICTTGGIGDLHVATMLGPKVLAQAVPRKLAAVSALPAPVRQAIEKGSDERGLVEALRHAGAHGEDTGEPSWGAFGHLIAETHFVHVARRLAFMRNTWAVPVDEYWAETHLSVASHRFRPYLESLALPAREAHEALAGLAAGLDLGALELTALPITRATSRLPGARATYPWRAVLQHVDPIARDLAMAADCTRPAPKYGRRLLNLSPNSPFGRALMIDYDWEMAREHMEEWRNDPATGDAPAVLGALARRFTQMKRIDEAQEMLHELVQQSPEKWAYELLAANEKNRGDMVRWQNALEEFLRRGEDTGLDHAQVRAEIANHFMGLGQWSRAQPYAESAAETWAGWAMDCAGHCNEGMCDYDRAEYWFRNVAERYPDSSMNWFNFCLRTLHGDLDAATRVAEDYVIRKGDDLSDNEKSLAVLIFEMANDLDQGIAFNKSVLAQQSPNPEKPGGRFARWVEAMFLARLADARDNRKLRDACWAEVARVGPPKAAKTVAMFRESLDASQAKPFDTKAFDALMASTEDYPRSFLCYFAAHFLERHGNVADAFRYWERCIEGIPGGNKFVPLMAKTAMRRRLDGKIPDDPHLYTVRGLYHRQADELDLALKDMDRALALDPKRVEILNYRGVIKRAAGDLEGSVSDFNRALELAPDDPIALSGRGITRAMLGQDEPATSDIARAIEVAPKQGFGHVARGLHLLAQGRRAEADEAFDQALRLDARLGSTLELLKKVVTRKRGANEAEPPPSRVTHAASRPARSRIRVR